MSVCLDLLEMYKGYIYIQKFFQRGANLGYGRKRGRKLMRGAYYTLHLPSPDKVCPVSSKDKSLADSGWSKVLPPQGVIHLV